MLQDIYCAVSACSVQGRACQSSALELLSTRHRTAKSVSDESQSLSPMSAMDDQRHKPTALTTAINQTPWHINLTKRRG